jgi:flagellar basal-body rod protein FlgC
MSFDRILSVTNISASGLSAERLRMEVVANNIANASSTRTPTGEPFRRQEVVFASILQDALRDGGVGGGVKVVSIDNDPSDFRKIHAPGHPDADEEGMVLMPNVDLPVEMVNLITATRAYEANMRVLQSFRQMAEQSFVLVGG